MIGFQQVKSDVMPPMGMVSASGYTSPGRMFSAWYFRSLPVQKARSPAPVTIATNASGSSRNSVKASRISLLAGGCRALYTSGRSIVTYATRLRIS